MARQLRTIKEGEEVQLALHSNARRDPWIVDAVLLGREGSGNDEKIYFTDKGDPRNSRWEVFRFKGHWAWGTSGSRLTVHDPDAPPRKPRVSRKTREVEAPAEKTAGEKNDAATAPKTRKTTTRRSTARRNTKKAEAKSAAQ